jgi:phosphatidylinositol alpha-mannosyltransferase
VTRHIEALAGELIEAGHDVRVLAPFDPDDATSRRLHRGARPEPREQPDYLFSLGRTIGFPANGAVSNLSAFPEGVARLRRELRSGRYDVAHLHEPVVPLACWDALCCSDAPALVGTYHTYSANALTNGIARGLGATRRMNRLHVRIAVSEAAAWTARRFFGGRYRVIPNGVRIPGSAQASRIETSTACAAIVDAGSLGAPAAGLKLPDDSDVSAQRPLKILFIGQAVERKGLPVLLRAFEALREQVPATLTLVGASEDEVAPLLLDDRGVTALGKVSEHEKLAALGTADLLCAPSLGGESFGMVLTEAFASGLPVVASDITGYRDVLRGDADGLLVEPGDPVALAEALRELALQPQRREQMARSARERAQRFAWPTVAAEVLDAYSDAVELARHERARAAAPVSRRGLLGSGAGEAFAADSRWPLATGMADRVGAMLPRSAALRAGLACVDGMPRLPPRRLPSLERAPQRSLPRRVLSVAARALLIVLAAAGVGFVLLALQRIGLAAVVASLVAGKPGLVAVCFGLMCAAMVMRGLAWHSILLSAKTWRRARLIDALQGTFIGVLMSATLPVRLGESSRALIVARRIGRARETLPVVLGTMVSQSLLNLLALIALGACGLLNVGLSGAHGLLIALAIAPVVALAVALLAPIVLMPAARGGGRVRTRRLVLGLRVVLNRLRAGLALFRHPRQALAASGLQLGAWALQWIACWVLARALGLGLTGTAALSAAAAVLFAVNATAVVPATPANVIVFQAACVVVLSGAYHVPGYAALAYGIVLQVVELVAAFAMGAPALVKEGLSWRELRRRTMHAVPVEIAPRGEREAAVDSGWR